MAGETDVQSEDDKDNADVENPAPNNRTSSPVLETAGDESEEDEDVDFNPFMKGSPLEEASSSLSSEVEGLDVEVVNSRGEEAMPASEGCVVGEVEDDDVVGDSCERDGEDGTVEGKKDGPSSGVEAVEDVSEPQMDMRDSRLVVDSDEEEDAICKRTRARYSLASFTLDELETFLQETDDEEDFQNVDEEEEYRKFLAAVMKGSDEEDQGNVEGNDDDDDDDEDNDADFEIEIEEALESDVDDCVITSHNDEEFERSSRRPKTRQNRRQKASASSRKKGVKREERPLRPLIPVMISARASSVPCLGAKLVTCPSRVQNLPVNGFVDNQIGQLHHLIYEHVQLLIQVYSLCVLEPSRQPIAAQVKGLLLELLHKRGLVLAWRTVAYPTSCFVPQNANSNSIQTQNCVPYSSVTSDGSDNQGCRWFPSIGGPLLSVLDVEPLKLAGKYIDDVSNVVREHQRRCLESTNICLEKQPLFPHPICPSPEAHHSVTGGGDYPSPDACAVSPNDKVPKKSLAATLVENTKKQSVALVPQQVAKLAQPFYRLFNSALFPHKPPSPSVTSRILFTDAEDVLLAMGMMEYNNDWKAIQHRFLPCKSEHQIFIRSKNRCSSKAPDNPIKTVRRLKTSPLTEDEKARIEEGLTTYRHDWTSVWRAVVPYRDPNLLPRQWRIAIGTQKSYKGSSDKKEKHRIYESNRRNKVAATNNSHTGPEEIMKENQTERCGMRNRIGEGAMDNGNEAYVHEAFLADWRPINAELNASKNTSSRLNSSCLPGNVVSGRFCDLQEVPNNNGNKDSQTKRDRAQEVSARSEDPHLNHNSFHAYMGYGHPSNVSTSNTEAFGCDSVLNSQNAQKPGYSNLVKLAPELPPVKLPHAVRVISQAFLRSSRIVSSTEVGAADHGPENPASDSTAVDSAAKLAKPVNDQTRVLSSNFASLSTQKGAVGNIGSCTEDRGTDLDPPMHPLLFRSLEEGHVPNYPVNNCNRIPTFSFFPALQHQMSVNLLQNSRTAGPAAGSQSFCSTEIPSTSSSLNFHPLLQRTSGFNPKSTGADSTSSLLATDLELSRDQYMEELIYRTGTDAAQLAASSEPGSPNTDAIDLDLDIHLSSSSRKRKMSSHEGVEINEIVPSVSAEKSIECENGRTNLHGQLSQHAPHHLSILPAAEDLRKSGFDRLATHLDKLGGGSNDDIGDQPLFEIVMEQEELSDSDEEMEDVEFECEEMTDSDGEEGSVAEQIGSMKHKDQEHASLSTGISDQRSKLGTRDVSKVNNQTQRKGRAPRADLTRLGKGNTKGSWLSLNSLGSLQTEQAGQKSSDSSAKTVPVTSTSTRYSRKATMSRKNSSAERTIESSGLDTLPSSSRRHRKTVSKAQSTSRAHVIVVNPSCTEKDGKV